MALKQPVDHILRPALPWRDQAIMTECGYDASKVSSITRGAYFKRKKDLGVQRAAMITCMTCSQTATRWQTWEQDPRKALGREIEWEARCGYLENRGQKLKDELTAIAALIEAHKDEFEGLVKQSEQRREWVAQKAARQRKQ